MIEDTQSLTGVIYDEALDGVVAMNDRYIPDEIVTEDEFRQYMSEHEATITEQINEHNEAITEQLNQHTTNVETLITQQNTNMEAQLTQQNENVATQLENQNREFDERLDAYNDDYLDIITPKDTASGELVQIKDALRLHTFENKIDGNVEQETTKGNQLFNFSTLVSHAGMNTSFKDDILTCVGTENSTIYNSTSRPVTNLIKNNPGKTIYLKYDKLETLVPSNGTIGQLTILYNDGTNNSYIPLITTAGAIKGYKIPSDTSNITEATLGIYTCNNNPMIVNTITITKPMLTFDENAEYEPYTGAQASPNPDYPQEIEVLESYNITPSSFVTKSNITKNGITIETLGVGSFHIYGTNTSGAFELVYISSNKTFENKFTIIQNTSDKISCIYNQIGRLNGTNFANVSVNTTPNVSIYVNENGEIDEYLTIMIIDGHYNPKQYLPYGCVGIKRNKKNIINTHKLYSGMSYNLELGVIKELREQKITFANTDENGVINFSSGSYDWANFTIKSDILPIGNYTLNVEREYAGTMLPGGTTVYICEELDNRQYKIISKLYSVQGSDNLFIPQNLTLSIEDKNRCVVVTFANNKVTENASVKLKVQLEPGEVATEIEPYQEQIVPLDLKGNWVGKINDNIKDYLVTDKRNYWLVKNLKKYVITGEETVTSVWRDNTTPRYGWRISIDNAKINTDTKIDTGLLSNYYRSNSQDVLYADSTISSGICLRTNSSEIIIKDNNVTTSTDQTTADSDFSNHLKELYESGKPLEVYYPQATPEIIELGELPESIKTFEGINNIQVLANLDTELEVKYALDIKKYTDNKLAEISAQII